MDLRNFETRLRIEKALMSREMPQFELIESGKEKYFIGWYTTSLKRNRYQLKISLSDHYPDKMPNLYVVTPRILNKKRGNGTLNHIGTSHAFHTLTNGPNGCVQLCHIGSQRWDASKTCIGVALQSILWTEAYEEYMKTDKLISDILVDWKRRQK